MKRFLLLLICFSFIIGSVIGDTNAENQDLDSGYIEYSDSFTAEDALKIAYSGKLEDGDTKITKQSIETGLEYARAMEQKSLNARKADDTMSSSSYEKWTITSQEVLKPYGVLKGKFLKKVPAGESISSNKVSITLSGTIKGIQLSAGVTLGANVSYSGPAGTDLVSSGVYATHRYYSLIASGKIVKYTFKVTDEISGWYLRTETYTVVTDGQTNTYSNLGCLYANTGYVRMRSSISNSVKYMKEATWISMINSENAWNYVGF